MFPRFMFFESLNDYLSLLGYLCSPSFLFGDARQPRHMPFIFFPNKYHSLRVMDLRVFIVEEEAASEFVAVHHEEFAKEMGVN